MLYDGGLQESVLRVCLTLRIRYHLSWETVADRIGSGARSSSVWTVWDGNPVAFVAKLSHSFARILVPCKDCSNKPLRLAGRLKFTFSASLVPENLHNVLSRLLPSKMTFGAVPAGGVLRGKDGKESHEVAGRGLRFREEKGKGTGLRAAHLGCLPLTKGRVQLPP